MPYGPAKASLLRAPVRNRVPFEVMEKMEALNVLMLVTMEKVSCAFVPVSRSVAVNWKMKPGGVASDRVVE